MKEIDLKEMKKQEKKEKKERFKANIQLALNITITVAVSFNIGLTFDVKELQDDSIYLEQRQEIPLTGTEELIYEIYTDVQTLKTLQKEVQYLQTQIQKLEEHIRISNTPYAIDYAPTQRVK